jgi:hypothetical protein
MNLRTYDALSCYAQEIGNRGVSPLCRLLLQKLRTCSVTVGNRVSPPICGSFGETIQNCDSVGDDSMFHFPSHFQSCLSSYVGSGPYHFVRQFFPSRCVFFPGPKTKTEKESDKYLAWGTWNAESNKLGIIYFHTVNVLLHSISVGFLKSTMALLLVVL